MRKKDIAGQRFGRLTAIEYSHHKHNSMWKCKCDCGKESLVSLCGLTTGKIRSCGCIHSEMLIDRNKKSALKHSESAFRALFSRYKRDAEKAGKWFDLTIEQFRDYTKMNCAYCGSEPSSIRKETYHKNGAYIYNGLDRLDSRKGYDIFNVVPACKRCNQAKNDMSLDEFFSWAKRLNGHTFGGVV